MNEIAGPRGGVFARSEALAAGFSVGMISRRLSSGEWAEVLPAVYRFGGVSLKREQRAHALLLWAGPTAALSHETAAEKWQLLRPDARRPVIVTVARRTKSRLREPGFEVRESRTLGRADVRTSRDGMRLTSPARTIVDLAPSMKPKHLEALFEEAFRRGLCSPNELYGALERIGNGRRGLSPLRAHLATRIAEGTDSKLEDLLFSILREAGIERPWTQVRLHSDEFEFSCTVDFAWPARRVVIEGQSHEHHSKRKKWLKDQDDNAGLTAAGWAFVPVTFADVEHRPQLVVKRIAATLAKHPPVPLGQIRELVDGTPEAPPASAAAERIALADEPHQPRSRRAATGQR